MTAPGGTLRDLSLHSRALRRTMRVRLYLPPRYGDFKFSYPTVYLLHRWGADERFWTDCLRLHEVADYLIGNGMLPPFVAVMPQGDKSFFINAEDKGGDFSRITRIDPDYFAGALEGYGDYGDYLLEDVIPFIEGKFAVSPRRAFRSVGGISMGATGAGILAFSRPDLFCAVGMHSPLLFSEAAPGPPWIFGLGDPQALAPRNPIALAAHLAPAQAPRIYLDCGLDDERLALTADLHYELEAHGLRHTYLAQPGTYEDGYWAEHLAEYLGFYTAEWQL